MSRYIEIAHRFCSSEPAALAVFRPSGPSSASRRLDEGPLGPVARSGAAAFAPGIPAAAVIVAGKSPITG